MAVKKKFASSVLGRGLDDIGTGRGLDALIDTNTNVQTEGSSNLSEIDIAQGSLEECRNYILFVRDLGYITSAEFEDLRKALEEASMFLNSYCKGIINNNGIKD